HRASDAARDDVGRCRANGAQAVDRLGFSVQIEYRARGRAVQDDVAFAETVWNDFGSAELQRARVDGRIASPRVVRAGDRQRVVADAEQLQVVQPRDRPADGGGGVAAGDAGVAGQLHIAGDRRAVDAHRAPVAGVFDAAQAGEINAV